MYTAYMYMYMYMYAYTVPTPESTCIYSYLRAYHDASMPDYLKKGYIYRQDPN
jgi:hypothetical protein